MKRLLKIAIGAGVLALAGAGVLFSEIGATGVCALVSAGSLGRVAVDGVSGRLVGPLSLARVEVRAPRFSLRGERVAIEWSLSEILHGRLHVSRLSARSIEIEVKPSGEPLRLPATLEAPVRFEVDALSVEQLSVSMSAGAQPVRLTQIAGRVGFDGRGYRLDALGFESDWGRVSGRGTLLASAPFAIEGGGQLASARHAARASMSLGGTLAQLSSRLEVEGVAGRGGAELALAPFSGVPLVRARISMTGLDAAKWRAGAPHTALDVEADLRSSREGATVALVGPVLVKNRAAARLDEGGVPITLMRGQMHWGAGVLEVSQGVAELPGGVLRGQARVVGAAVDAHLTVTGLDLNRLHGALRTTSLGGTLALASNHGRIDGRARLSDARISASVVGVYDKGMLDLSRVEISRGAASIEASGRLELGPGRRFEVAGALRDFDPAAFAKVPSARINARGRGQGGLLPTPFASGEFSLFESAMATPAGMRPLSGSGVVAWRDRHIERAELALDLAGNRLRTRGAFGRVGDVLRIDVDMPQAARLGLGDGAQVSGHLSVGDTLVMPVVSVDLDARGVAIDGVTVGRVLVRGGLARGVEGPVHVETSVRDVMRGGERVLGQAQATVEGTRRSHGISVAASAGEAALSAQFSGGLSSGLAWGGQVVQFEVRHPRLPLALARPARLAGSPAGFTVGPAAFRSVNAQLDMDELSFAQGTLRTRGQLHGAALNAPALAGSTLRIGGQWDVAWGAVRSGFVKLFRESGDVTFAGEVPLSLGLQEARLEARLAGGRLEVAGAARGARLGEIAGSGNLGLAGEGWAVAEGAPVSARLSLAVPSLDWIGPFVDPNLQSGGALAGEVVVSGTAREPQFNGALRGDGLMLGWVDQGVRWDRGVLRMGFSQSRARLEMLSFETPIRARPRVLAQAGEFGQPGRVEMSGEFDLAKFDGRFSLLANRAQIVAREDRWLVSSGEGTVVIDREGARFEGRTRVDAAAVSFAKSRVSALADDVVVLGRARAPERHYRLDVDLLADLGEHFHFAAQGVNARLAGQLRVRSAGRAPLSAFGAISVVEGMFDAYGQQLAIERGLVNFQGPIDNPGLNVRALRRGLAVEAGVEVSGTAQSPRVRLVSEPNVPDAEKLSWIVLGRGLDKSGPGVDASLLASAAGALLGAGDIRRIPQQLAQGLGLDVISVTSAEQTGVRTQTTVAGSIAGTRDSTTGSVVQLGKRLSQAAYLSYEHSLTGVENMVKLTYQLSRRLSLVGRAGSDNAVDLFYTFSFN